MTQTFAHGGNTTTTPLAANEAFTGDSVLNELSGVGVSCKTDVEGTLYFDFSNDGTNWDAFPPNGFVVTADVHEVHKAEKFGRYFRVRFVNGSSAQSYLRIYTYFGSYNQLNSPLNQSASLDQDAIFVRGSVAIDEVSLGRRTGVTKWNKFGYNLDVDTGTEVVAAFGGTFTPLDSAETFTISYDGTGGGSTDGAGTNGALTLYFQYIDANGLPATATHTLGTDGSDVTSFTGLGINRCAVSSSGSTDANGSAITITATTAGTNQALIPAGESVTQQCIFFVGSNHKAIAKFINLNVLKLSGSSPVVTIKGWVYNRAVQTKYLIYREKIDSAVENTITLPADLGFNLNATDVFWFEATTNQDNTVVDMRFDLVEYQNS